LSAAADSNFAFRSHLTKLHYDDVAVCLKHFFCCYIAVWLNSLVVERQICDPEVAGTSLSKCIVEYTRGDQKVLQCSMMYKWQRQNSYIIFQCNLPVHQYTSDICQKVLLFQSNRIPGACCRDTTPWAVTAHHHQKNSFREGAVSEVEIGRSRWVSGRVSKVGETAAQTRCP